MADVPVVMISSTARDLPAHRKEVMDACLRMGMFPKMMEHLPAEPADAVRHGLLRASGVREARIVRIVGKQRHQQNQRDHADRQHRTLAQALGHGGGAAHRPRGRRFRDRWQRR